jgi:hypothetical protein
MSWEPRSNAVPHTAMSRPDGIPCQAKGHVAWAAAGIPLRASRSCTATDVSTAINEFVRFADKQGLPPDAFLPRDLFTYEVDLQRVLDLSSPETQRAVGLEDTWPTDHDLRRCQQVGEAAYTAGLEAMRAPSVVGPGDVLAVFIGRLVPGSRLRDSKREVWKALPERP